MSHCRRFWLNTLNLICCKPSNLAPKHTAYFRCKIGKTCPAKLSMIECQNTWCKCPCVSTKCKSRESNSYKPSTNHRKISPEGWSKPHAEHDDEDVQILQIFNTLQTSWMKSLIMHAHNLGSRATSIGLRFPKTIWPPLVVIQSPKHATHAGTNSTTK